MQHLMNTSMWHKAITVTMLALLLAVGAFATTLTQTAHAAPPATHCLIVLDRLHPGEQSSRVLSRHCVQANQPLVAPAGSTHLMRWWADAGYRGDFTDVDGSSGPCDSTGYGFNYVGDGWNDRISSFQVFNNCTFTRAYSDADYGGVCQAYSGDTSYVGYALNDAISSLRIASVGNHC